MSKDNETPGMSGEVNKETQPIIEYVSDEPKPMVKSNPNYHKKTPNNLKEFAQLLWPLIYGNLRDTQEKPSTQDWNDYSIEVYRIAFLLMTGEDSKYIPNEEAGPMGKTGEKIREDCDEIIDLIDKYFPNNKFKEHLRDCVHALRDKILTTPTGE